MHPTFHDYLPRELTRGKITFWYKQFFPGTYCGSIMNKVLFFLLFLFYGNVCIGESASLGCVRGDCKNGQGTFYFKTGEKYEGDWQDGKFHGQGTSTSALGDKYIGEWSNQKPHGKGIVTFVNKEKYEGDWQDGKFHGQGTYFYPNGDKYNR